MRMLICILATVLLSVGASAPVAAIEESGTVVGWGWDEYYGQATPPARLSNVIAISTGIYHSIALTSDGNVVSWGLNTSGETDVPTDLTDVIAIEAGGTIYDYEYGHSLALKADGTVVGWGSNINGQTSVPPELNNVVAIAAGAYHSLALKADGTVVGWGWDIFDQASPPVDLYDVVAISGGAWHSLALTADGSVIVWGHDGWGQWDVPEGLIDVVAVTAGSMHNLALKADGTIVVWGNNSYGQADVPEGLIDVVAVSGGFSHSLALVASQSAGDLLNIIRARINELAADNPDAFKSNPDERANTFSNKIDAIIESLEVAEMETEPAVQDELYDEAINKLENDIRAKMDGCLGGNAMNDCIVDCTAQGDINSLIDDVVEAITELKNSN
jgi:hypothetical protein